MDSDRLGVESYPGVKMRTKRTSAAAPLPSRVDVSILESLFDQVPDVAFFVKDAAGRYTSVNDSLVRRHGLQQKSQVIGRRPRDICPGDFGNIPSAQDSAVLRTGRPIVDHLELHWYAPHKPGWCLTTKMPIRSENGKVVGIIGISRDLRTPVEEKEIPAGIAEALNYLEANLSEELTPAALARLAGMATHRFARFMKRYFGVTPSQYIAKARVSAASRLLRETDESVAAIALACGFYDHSAFTRAFRKLTGTTPSKVRDGNDTASRRV